MLDWQKQQDRLKLIETLSTAAREKQKEQKANMTISFKKDIHDMSTLSAIGSELEYSTNKSTCSSASCGVNSRSAIRKKMLDRINKENKSLSSQYLQAASSNQSLFNPYRSQSRLQSG